MINHQICIRCLFILLACLFNPAYPASNKLNLTGEYRLKQTLLNGHDPSVRPVLDDGDKVEVKFEIALQQIVEVNEKEESISLSAYIRQRWKDPNLYWNAEDYNNLASITLSPDKLWLPDITLYNNVERENIAGNLDQLTNRIIVYNNSNIKWLAPAILSSKCKMNIRYFPFDTQHCNLTFGSWTYHGFQLDIIESQKNVDIGAFNVHSEWNLQSAVHHKNVFYYGCCVEPYPDVTVALVIKRRPLFHVLNLILPMILIGGLTLLSFFLPAQSGERLSFAVTLLLAMTVFMLMVAEMIPASSETIPLLGVYFTAVTVEMVLMIFTMCYTMKLHLKNPGEDEHLPPWLEKIVYEKLAYLCRVRSPKMKKTYEFTDNTKQNLQISNGDINEDGKFNHGIENGRNTPPVFVANGHDNDSGVRHRKPAPVHHGKDTVASLMQKNLAVMTDKYKLDEKEKHLKYQYEVCAQTLDCFALFIYSVLFVIITLAYVFSNPVF